MNRYDCEPPEGTTHWKLFPLGTDYFFKVERTLTGNKWFLFGETWQEYPIERQDPDIQPIHCRRSKEVELKRALESLVLFSKPSKVNAVALNYAHQVLSETVSAEIELPFCTCLSGKLEEERDAQIWNNALQSAAIRLKEQGLRVKV